MVDFSLTQDHTKFLSIITFTILVNFTVFLVPTESPFAVLRWVFGLFLSLFIPGYCLVWALFSKNEFDIVETIVLSVGLSLALISIVALVVNFILGNISELPIVVSLSILIITEAIVAIFK